ncbi:MAG: ComF family protein [Cyanobacteriota bacterium]|nr:ComF family protein [Cyanobacteriota bacterium]
MFKSLLSLFLKSNCPLCDRATSELLCPACSRQLAKMQLSNCARRWPEELPAFAWGMYDGLLKRAIAALKYENHPELAQPLGFHLGKAWLDWPNSTSLKNATVVPIPMHPKKLQQRGFNQAELIGRSFCQYTRLKLQPSGLERARETEAMFGLSQRDRATNVAGAFILGKSFQRRLPRSPILLLDDIYTTGATARSAAQTLSQQGIEVLGIVAVATPLTMNNE